MFAYSFRRGGAAHCVNLLSREISSLGYEVKKIDAFGGTYGQFIHIFKIIVTNMLMIIFFGRPSSGVKRSLGLFSSQNIKKNLFESTPPNSISHFHWIGNESISNSLLRRIPKNSIITLHDEYLLNGVDHYYRPELPVRYLGTKIDALVFRKKRFQSSVL